MTWSHYKEAFSSLIYKCGLYNKDICITPVCSIFIRRGCLSIILANVWLNRLKRQKRQKKELMELSQSHGPATSLNILPCLLRAIALQLWFTNQNDNITILVIQSYLSLKNNNLILALSEKKVVQNTMRHYVLWFKGEQD